MERAKKVEGREFVFDLSLELGVSPRQIEDEMSIAEYKEWQMYFQDNAFQKDVSEIQMAQLLGVITSYLGGKTNIRDFLVSGKHKKVNSVSNDINTASAEEIDKFLGVNNG